LMQLSDLRNYVKDPRPKDAAFISAPHRGISANLRMGPDVKFFV
jgi:hypothetical protein